MVRAFAKYDATDARIRKLEMEGNHVAAVALCVGNGVDESNGLFAAFDAALQHVIKINMDAFAEKISAGHASVLMGMVLTPISTLAIALLAYFGIRVRLREYEV